MTAGDIINESYFPAQPDDTLQQLLDRMAEFKVAQLPVVDQHTYMGLVLESDLLEEMDEDALKLPVAHHSLHLIFIYENQHIYDALRLFHVHQLDLLPVVDEQQQFVGVICHKQLLNALSESILTDEQGGIVVLEIGNRDNSLAHLAQLVEADNTQIMSSAVRNFPDSTRLEVTLKLNRTDISSVIASFMRHDYVVKATYNDSRSYDTTRNRYDQLMNYLDL